MGFYRSHRSAELNISLVGQKVRLSGWVHKLRDHGGVTFVDLRDVSGICQVVIPPSVLGTQKLRSEFVIKIDGEVRARPSGSENKKMASGQIEVQVSALEVLSESDVLPFSLDDENAQVNENTRLKYRYLDLRRSTLQKNLKMRHQVLQISRRFFDAEGFLEIETPILYKSTPEGARDYLVPSRIYPGEFYALPQSPQTLKQILMIGGLDRYCQIARCFRDEDLRADRQPEFTQIDLEASFLSREEFMAIIERFVQRTWKEVLNVEIPLPFRRMSYDEAMSSYGSDKPDLRYGLKIQDVSELVAQSAFNVFASTVRTGGRVLALPVRKKELSTDNVAAPQWTRKFFDGLNGIVGAYGMKGVAWVRIENGAWNSPITKFFKPEELKALETSLEIEEGDYVFFAAEKAPRVYEAMGALRAHLARELGLVKSGLSEKWPFCWITEFPLFVVDEKNGSLAAAHHPFTRPNPEDVAKLMSGDKEQMKDIKAEAYDLALNGFEIAGGSLRIYDSKVQAAMFAALGLSAEEAQEKFGFFIDALKYGTPPHGGMAFGLDRLVMLLCGTEAIRDVMAFPKTASASCLMSACPSPVSPEQMAELRLQVIKAAL